MNRLVVNKMAKSARRVRREKGLTLKRVAEITGISEPFLAQVERGERRISAEHAEVLSKLYGVAREEIFLASRYSIRIASEPRAMECRAK